MRYDFNPMFAIRGTVSNGFRAPTLAEERYSGTNVSPYSAEVQLPPNSAAAQLAGFQPLKPELSQNYSVGFVANPIDNLQITFDAYQINIHNRILVSGFIYGTNTIGGQIVTDLARGAERHRRAGCHARHWVELHRASRSSPTPPTRGRTASKLTANYASDFGDYGHVDWTVGANYNKTQLTKTPPLPAAVTNAVRPDHLLHAALGQRPDHRDAPGEGHPAGLLHLAQIQREPAGDDLRSDPPMVGKQLALRSSWHHRDHRSRPRLQGSPPPSRSMPARTTCSTRSRRAAPISGGGRVYSVPYGFAPWGGNGGYYYGRVVVNLLWSRRCGAASPHPDLSPPPPGRAFFRRLRRGARQR